MSNQNAVTNIFSLLTMAGNPLANFPRDEDMRQNFIALAGQTLNTVGAKIKLSEEQRLQFTAKFGVYCMANRALAPGRVEHMPNIVPLLAEAIIAKPVYLHSRSISNILKAHMQRKHQASAQLRQKTQTSQADSGPPPVLWTSADGHTLVELLTPQHLHNESAAIEHCIGTRYNKAALAQKGLSEADPAAEQYLRYMIKMRRRESRIFSLRDAHGVPVATLNYDPKTCEVVELEVKGIHLKRGHSQFGFICEALHALSQQMPVAKIHAMPSLSDNLRMFAASGEICTTTGEHKLLHNLRLPNDMLHGMLKIPATIAQPHLLALLDNPRLTLDISALEDTKRLPSRIKAGIIISNLAKMSDHYDLSHVVQAADITINSSSVDLSGLKRCDNLTLPYVKDLQLPQLEHCKNLDAFEARNLHAPRLRSSSGLQLPQLAGEIFLPVLNRALQVIIGLKQKGRLQKLEMPALRSCLHFSSDASTVNLPALEYCDALSLPEASHANLDKLVSTGALCAPELRRLNAPELVETAAADLSNCDEVHAPKYVRAEELHVNIHTRLNLPVLGLEVPVHHDGNLFSPELKAQFNAERSVSRRAAQQKRLLL